MPQAATTLGPDGRFQLRAKLAKDVFGTIWTGRDARLNRPVSIRVVDEDWARDPLFIARNRWEIRRLLRPSPTGKAVVHVLACPGAIKPLGFGVGEPGGTEFVVMEPVQGLSLATNLGPSHVPRVTDAGQVATHVADIMRAVHEAGVVHGALTPASVFIDARGRVQLIDFGLACAAAAAVKAAGKSVAKLSVYLAPEHPEHGRLSPASDVYSLGAIIHELLFGFPPDSSQSGNHSSDQPLGRAFRDDGVPSRVQELTTVCYLALDSRPELRPTMESMSWTLRRALGREAT